MKETIKWPYPNETDKTTTLSADVVVLGGGISGCMAAISAAKKGRSVIVVEKAGIIRSGSGGSGCDHWEQCASNPCSSISPEEMQHALMDYTDGFNNPISHYIEAKEGWDCLLDIEKMGGKIRDEDNQFIGADFRDEETKLLFAYDYISRTTLRVWGTTFKPAMLAEMKRLNIKIVEHVTITSLLTEDIDNKRVCIGATGISGRTGRFYSFSGKAIIMALSRPARVWFFSAAYPGLCEFRPMSCIGSGHAMGWRVGAEFTMMEKSVQGEFSAAGRSYPPYGTGNNHNTWYPATIIDSNGKEIPYINRDGEVLKLVKDRFKPAKGQKYFLKGGNIDKSYYPYDGPEIPGYEELLNQGYKLPFYADISSLPKHERDIIWGMMVSEEGKTKVPIYDNYTSLGFDPNKHVLQCYAAGWKSANFLPQERQLFGLSGGFMNDWQLMSNISGLFVCGDALFSSNCYGHAATTGAYAGRHAASYADNQKSLIPLNEQQVEKERIRVLAPLKRNVNNSFSWKELNQAISKNMQNHCGAIKEDGLLKVGLAVLKDYEENVVPLTSASNPHELVRLLEVFDILTVAQLIIESCLARKGDCPPLEFYRSDSQVTSAEFIVISKDKEKIMIRHEPLNFAGNIIENYQLYNFDYIKDMKSNSKGNPIYDK